MPDGIRYAESAELEIVEIIRRADKGVTRPFVCRAEDDAVYFVKGRNLPRRELVAEFICAELADRFGLNKPVHRILFVPPGLLSEEAGFKISDLGDGPVFGSLALSSPAEITVMQAARLDVRLCSDIAAFDYWVGNSDRTLTERGGNPNILMELDTLEPVMIDHNLAFDFELRFEDLMLNHVFRSNLGALAGSAEDRLHYAERFGLCLEDWEGITDKIPHEWFYRDRAQTEDADIEISAMRRWLARLSKGGNWT